MLDQGARQHKEHREHDVSIERLWPFPQQHRQAVGLEGVSQQLGIVGSDELASIGRDQENEDQRAIDRELGLDPLIKNDGADVVDDPTQARPGDDPSGKNIIVEQMTERTDQVK